MNCKTCFKPCDTTSGYCSVSCMSTSLGTDNNSYTCTPNERAFLDEIRELYEWNDHLGFPHLQRKKITKFSNIYQQDFTKSNLKELVNDHT